VVFLLWITCITELLPSVPGRPCGPSDPVAPAGPAAPVSPCGPCSPAGPCGPSGPVSPGIPCSPCGPGLAARKELVNPPAKPNIMLTIRSIARATFCSILLTNSLVSKSLGFWI